MTTPTWLIPATAIPGHLTLVDVIVVLLVVGAFAGALRRRRGLLAAVGSSLAAALVCWVAAAAVVAWAPSPWPHAVTASALAGQVPLPVTAVQQAGQLAQHLTSQAHTHP